MSSVALISPFGPYFPLREGRNLILSSVLIRGSLTSSPLCADMYAKGSYALPICPGDD